MGDEEDTVLGATEFTSRVERSRHELRVHCYRMVGSFDLAEDLVQETLLLAWRRRSTLRDPAAFRAWLYRIATNCCLEQLRRQPRRAAPAEPGRAPSLSATPWLQPFPDALLDEAAAADDGPEEYAIRHEAIALAFLVTIQLLTPQQRAVLLLREVLKFTAAETAELLEVSVPAANSALQRARATLTRYRQAPETDPPRSASTTQRALLARYITAHERADPDAIIEVLRDDARLTVSPMGLEWDGREGIAPTYREAMGALGDWRCVATSANRQPAVAHYLRRFGDDAYRAFSLVVLDLRDDAIAEIATFAEPSLFTAFGLPSVLVAA